MFRSSSAAPCPLLSPPLFSVRQDTCHLPAITITIITFDIIIVIPIVDVIATRKIWVHPVTFF